jgi:hypothetical protein
VSGHVETTLGIFKSIKRLKVRRVLERHFDLNFYLRRYNDVAASGADPLTHYIEDGWREKRWPRTDFDPVFYLDAYPDVSSEEDPFLHYITFGIAEGRRTVSLAHDSGELLRTLVIDTQRLRSEVQSLGTAQEALDVGGLRMEAKLRATEQMISRHVEAIEAATARIQIRQKARDQAVKAQRAELEGQGEQLREHGAQIEARRAQIEAHGAHLEVQGAQLARHGERIELHDAQILGQDAQLTEDRAQAEGQTTMIAALRGQVFALERLLTGTASARPPGAESAVAALDAPAVAVIIPTFNRPKFLPEAIASVQRQSFEDWELVVVGDGSGADTEAAVAPFLSDHRIRFVWQERAGSANARNRGIAETRAPLIAYLDDDNLWYPDFLARAVDCMATRADVDVLYGALVTYAHGLDRTCILWRPFSRDELLRGNFIDTSTILHRRSLIARYGCWDQSVARLGDWYLMLRFTAERPAYALDVLAAYYRVCDDTRMSLAPDGATKTEILRRNAAASLGPFTGG